MGVVQDFSVPGSTKTGEVFLCPADLPWRPAICCFFVFQVLVKEHRENGGARSRQELSLDDGTGTSPSPTV